MSEEIRYWKIGTSPISMIKKFIQVLNKGMKVTKDFSIFKDRKENWIVDSLGNKIFNLKSNTTCRQHLDVWKSLGFIEEKNENNYSIITKFKDLNQLIEYSKLFINKESNNKEINRYRKTIIINILVNLNILNKRDIENKNLKKTKGNLITIKEIKSVISNYEKILSKDHKFVNEILSIVIKKNLGKIIFL